ncbi:PREDICTED: WD repeat-containing protein 1 [Myotis brandtii]|uniref:WD repeat-containing protein 1 n=1 Tax=Myotis brandtii TaxID=109478 RepID=UPI0003BB7851|nr:PREDICTED: WD repeat-containing protein 1 [Myotis brandtii]
MGFTGFGEKARTFDLEAMFEQTRRTAVERSRKTLEAREKEEEMNREKELRQNEDIEPTSSGSDVARDCSQSSSSDTSISGSEESSDSSDELIGPPLPPTMAEEPVDRMEQAIGRLPPPLHEEEVDGDDDDGGRGGRVGTHGGTLSSYIVKNIALDKTDDSNPREAILRHAKAAEDNPPGRGAPNVRRCACVSAEKVFASLPQVERGVSKILGGDPKGNNFLYTNGKCVIIRNIDNPALADIYTEHAHQVVVAKYAPSGFYIASGDVSGKLRIWDTTQKEHLLKYEYQPFAGKIKDIAWTEDSKRIAVVGEGREKFGAVFLWDSGSSVGEITGHNKVINSVDIKQTRPYRLVTGSDDNCAAFFEGPPFKFKFTIGDHSRFVNCVRFSPDGNRFATASADGQIHIYDGKTGENVCALGGSKAHDGGIYAISWSPDSTHLLSASGDKTSKIWDVNVNSVVTTFTMGSNVLDQQLGCLWQKDHLLSISLSGYINYLDKNNPSKPLRVIKGHSKSIQCLTVHKNGGKSYIYSGSHDGHINYWDSETGENDSFTGKGHTNQVSRMTVDESGQLVSCSMDDTVRYTNLTLRDYSGQGVVKLDVQPKCVAVGPGGYTVVVCIGQIVLLKDQKKCFSIDSPGYEPEVVAVHPSGDMVAVGATDGNVRLYSILGTSLKDEGKLLEAKGPVTDLAYSHDGAFLAVCDASKVVTVFSVADGYAENNVFYGHHAKIVCLAWSPDNEHFASGGMDMMVYVWTLSDPETRVKIQDAHRLHHVSSLAWLDEHTLVTTSHDASVKEWTISY